MHRRRFLTSSSALALASALMPRLGRAQSPPSSPPLRPPSAARYHVLIMMSGGVDNVFTLDPKRRADVDAAIDVPYAADKIVTGRQLELGPHFAQLRDKSGMLGVVNGVRTGTASHIAGAQAFLRLKEAAPTKMPAILNLIARQRETQPLATVSLGALFASQYTSDYFGVPDAYLGGNGTDVFAALEKLTPDELAVTSGALAVHAKELVAIDANAAASARAVAQLCDRLRTVKPAATQPLGGDASLEAMHRYFDRALWVIENDLAAGVFVHLSEAGKSDWDSHLINEKIQAPLNLAFAKVFDRFLGELAERKNAHGTLLQQTQIVAASELGRFPILNDGAGKDHLPQTSFVLAGSNTANGAFGGTGRQMEGARVSLRDGKKSDDGANLRLGDIGASLLWRAGLDPAPYGYDGNILRFLWS